MNIRDIFVRYSLVFISSLIFLFLYIPIVVLIIFSFSNSSFGYEWNGFTLKWYYGLFQSSQLLFALKNSFIVASCAVFFSVSLSLLYIYYSPRKFLQRTMQLFYVNIMIPEIILAVGLLGFLVWCKVPLGLPALVMAHTVIGFGYVVPILYSRFVELDKKFSEAARDLGATHTQTLTSVMIPLLMPAILASSLLVFVVSLDDFIVSFFCAGATAQTLPLYIFATIRAGATPEVNALSTLLLGVSSILVLLFSLLQVRKIDILS